MSIAELNASYGAPSDGPPDDRLPPQDLNAEQSVLGSMLLNKDAIADCLEAVKSHDFYRPAHELIFDAVLDLFGRGEPADAITVADELGKRGDLTRVGGQAYLHQLIQSVPTAAHAGYYAEIVHERAVLRRLVEAGTRIVQMGYGQGEGDIDEIVNRAQAEVYSVAEKRGGEDYHALGELLNETMKYFQEQESFSMDDFSEKVIRQPEVVESFSRFRQEYEQDRDIRIEDEFGISDSAVRKQARSYKSVIKLDRNFHIYVHGNRNLLEQGEDEKGKFYKVYYEEEE